MKLKLIRLLILIVSLFILSCDEGSDHSCNVDIDPVPTPVCFIVNDGSGNNLLDARFEGNILDDGIEVVYKDMRYPLLLSEYDPSTVKMGLHTGVVGPDKTPGEGVN